MQTVFRLLSAIVLSALLSACATKGPSFELAPKPKVDPAAATVYVLRNPGYFASWITTNLYIDSRKVGGLREETFTWFQVAPGKHKFGAAWVLTATAPELEKEYDFPAGSTTYLVLDSRLLGNQYSREFRPITAAEAQSILQRYTYHPDVR